MPAPSKALNSAFGTLPSGTTTKTIPFGFTATAGRVLVVIASAAANQTAPAGWTEHLNFISDVEISVFTRTAAGGETDVALTQNGPRPLVYAVYEFPASTTFSPGSTSSGATEAPISPVSGLPGGSQVVLWVDARQTVNAAATADATWGGDAVEHVDTIAAYETSGGFEGTWLSIGWSEPTGTSTSATMSMTASGLNATHHKLVIAIYPPSGPSNNPPTANAGSDQSVTVNTLVTLNGSGSSDSDGTIASYSWAQASGTSVTLSGSGSSRTFTPTVAGTYVFGLTVTDDDGATSTEDFVTITVTDVSNTAPTANAGPDQSVTAGQVVTLTGAASSDPDGTIASYGWTQTGGTTVTLSGSGATRTFTPTVAGTYTFSLVVVDNGGASSSPDTVNITVTAAPTFPTNVAEENALPGMSPSLWFQGLSGLQLPSFARSTYYLPGQTAQFSVDYNSAFTIQIMRFGYYAGNGAREVAAPVAATPVEQPAPTVIAGSNGAITCAGWSINATWEIPTTALPGWYMAVFRNTAGDEHGFSLFQVSDKNTKRPIVIVASDSTWHAAYNGYGGNNVYGASTGIGSVSERAFCSTYDKPVITKDYVPQTHFFNATYPYLKWSERMGINAGYTTIEQIHNDPTILDGRQLIVWTGHNEYVSQTVMNKTKSLLAGAQNMVNIAGNDFFWRVKFTNGAFSSNTNGRVMWCKKDTMPGPTTGPDAEPTHVGGVPFTTEADWTGTWQDTRWSLREPSEDFFGDRFIANGIRADQVKVPASMKIYPAWRNCPGIQALTTGQEYTFAAGTLGMEWDMPVMTNTNVNQVMFSQSEIDLINNASDVNGQNYGTTAEDTVHGFSIVKKGSSYIANFNSDQWPWALDPLHVRGSDPADVNAMQMMLNVLTDLGAPPASSSYVSAAGLTLPTRVTNLDNAYGILNNGVPIEPGIDITVVVGVTRHESPVEVGGTMANATIDLTTIDRTS